MTVPDFPALPSTNLFAMREQADVDRLSLLLNSALLRAGVCYANKYAHKAAVCAHRWSFCASRRSAAHRLSACRLTISRLAKGNDMGRRK